MTHDRKGRGEEGRLDALVVIRRKTVIGFESEPAETLIELMPECRAQQSAQRPAEHEAESTAEYFSPPGHNSVLILRLIRKSSCRRGAENAE